MSRIGLLLAIVILAAGCGVESTVVLDEGQTSITPVNNTVAAESADTGMPAEDMVEPTKMADQQEEDDTDSKQEEAAEEADEEKEMTVAQKLQQLRKDSATPEELFAFAKEHAGTEEAFAALNGMARSNELSAEQKKTLMAMMSDQFVMNDEAADSQVFQASMFLMTQGEESGRDAIASALVKRFVESKDELDRMSNQVIGMLMQIGSPEVKKQVNSTLLEKFADSDAILSVLQRMSRGIPSQDTEGFLDELAKKSTNEKVQGMALMTMVQFLNSVPDAKGYIEDPRFVKQFGEDTVNYIKDFDEEAGAERVESLLNRITEDFADVKMGRQTLGEMAAGELFVINHLSIGKEAPDIEGEDLDGEAFKLSDYRGKVVMLDFWGDW